MTKLSASASPSEGSLAESSSRSCFLRSLEMSETDSGSGDSSSATHQMKTIGDVLLAAITKDKLNVKNCKCFELLLRRARWMQRQQKPKFRCDIQRRPGRRLRHRRPIRPI